LNVGIFQSADEVDYLAAGVRSTGGSAEVGAAAEGAVLVDEAAGGGAVEEGAGSILALRQRLAAGCLEGAGGKEGFSPGQVGSFSGQLKVAALGAKLTGTGDWTIGQILVDGANDRESGLLCL
jgi:hypothetical protein